MKEFFKHYGQTVILLLSIIIGAIIGLIWKEGATVLSPFGDIFLNLMFVIIVPLVFLTISTSIARIKQPKRLGKIMGSIVFNIQSSKLNKMSLDEKLYLDLRALDISHSECSQSDISTNYFDGDFIIYQWIIAIFIDDNEDFHFMRKSWDNDWWHKRGFNLEKPINYDDDFRTIYNPEKCNIDNSYKNAKYVKCLKLKYKRKEEFLH